MKPVYAIVMAGGRGERFWPMSTARRPKQVLTLFAGKSLIARTLEYVEGLVPPERVLIVTNAALVDPIAAALPGVPRRNIVGEPVGRDTAAAIALGSALVRHEAPDAVMLVLTADHLVEDPARFRVTLRAGCAYASEHAALITMGIAPTYPSTGFGYIEAERPLETRDGVEFWAAKRFVEKPDLPTAERYVAGGRHCWNSGMFIWSLDSLRAALARHRPPLLAMADRLESAVGRPEFDERLAAEYAGLEKISVDYAIMEKSDNIVMIRGTFGWDDVGSWSSVENHFPSDAAGNVALGPFVGLDAKRNVVVSPDRLTALIGVEDLIVVHAEGATLVCRKDRAQDVRAMVKLLQQRGGHEALL
jgi:mannose-1-phosphate guanylyltransferase